MWQPYFSAWSLPGSPCTPPSQKAKSLPWSGLAAACWCLWVLVDSISLLNSPGWHCSNGHAAWSFCATWNSQIPYILLSLSWLGLQVPCVWDWGPMLWELREPLSCVFYLASLLASPRFLGQGVSPSSYKISYQNVQSTLSLYSPISKIHEL